MIQFFIFRIRSDSLKVETPSEACERPKPIKLLRNENYSSFQLLIIVAACTRVRCMQLNLPTSSTAVRGCEKKIARNYSIVKIRSKLKVEKRHFGGPCEMHIPVLYVVAATAAPLSNNHCNKSPSQTRSHRKGFARV